MQLVATLDRVRYNAFTWRKELSVPWKIALAVGFAILTALLAQIKVAVPWSPIPITGQTFAVLLAGVLLGRWWGGASMAIYMVLGFVGVPWLTGGLAGFGATTGYLVGFVAAALFIGHFTDKLSASKNFYKLIGLMLVASLGIIYIPGVVWFGMWSEMVLGTSISIGALLGMTVAPFIIGDIVKAVMAASAAKAILPKE